MAHDAVAARALPPEPAEPARGQAQAAAAAVAAPGGAQPAEPPPPTAQPDSLVDNAVSMVEGTPATPVEPIARHSARPKRAAAPTTTIAERPPPKKRAAVESLDETARARCAAMIDKTDKLTAKPLARHLGVNATRFNKWLKREPDRKNCQPVSPRPPPHLDRRTAHHVHAGADQRGGARLAGGRGQAAGPPCPAAPTTRPTTRPAASTASPSASPTAAG